MGTRKSNERSIGKRTPQARKAGMSSDYTLNFLDHTYGEFFEEDRVKIDAECYKVRSTS